MNVSLRRLLPDCEDLADLPVRGIKSDSREVEPGDLFIAIPGQNTDGRNYIQEVEGKQAVAILCEAPAPNVDISIPMLEIENLSVKAGYIASLYYGEPSRKLKVIAITGTNGKTSCSHFVSQALSSVGMKCGVVGTMGAGVSGELVEINLTTPGSLDMQKYLAQMVGNSCRAVAIEASSHGLEQARLSGTSIDTAVFTNISHDHMDYHEGFDSYKRAKAKLFLEENIHTAIIDIDDEFGVELCAMVSDDVKLIKLSAESPSADIYCRDIKMDSAGMKFLLVSPWGEARIKTSLMGRFNINNLLVAVAVLGSEGYPLADIARAVASVNSIRGRMEIIDFKQQPTVIIDYAHTPDALEKALSAVKEHCRGDLWCVFGCGGDRDKDKRPLMGAIASTLAKHVIITDDNPRGEASILIANEIARGVVAGSDVEIETDRRAAIKRVLSNAGPKDVVLIAGKGHEDYQEISGQRKPFSDHDVVHEFIGGS